MADFGAEERSGFLRFAAFVANAFMVVFALDAMISAVSAIAFDGRGELALVTFLLLVLTLAAVLLAFFVPHIPKLVLLPPIVFIVWVLVGSPPFPPSLSNHDNALPVAIVQLLVAALSFGASYLTTGDWLLDASRLPHKSNLVTRTLIALPVFGLVSIVAIAGLVVTSLVFLIEDQTKDYLHFGSQGVEVRETVFKKGDKEVHLVGTVHFAEPRFYQELYASVPPTAVILAEGITDKNGVLTKGLPYGNAAHALGLETQGVFEQLMRKGQGNETAPSPAEPSSKTDKPLPPAPKASGPAVVRADIDASDFTPTTIRFLAAVGDVYSSATMTEAIQKLSKLGEQFTDDEVKQVWADILDKRNAKVLSDLDKNLPNYQIVFIPWGAEHMPGLEAGLLQRGFVIDHSRMILLARYDTIFGALGR